MPQQASLGVNILQGIPQPQPFGTLQNMQALGQMAEQEQAKAQSQRAQAELQRVMQQYADDPDEGVNELRRKGFANEATALEKHLGEIRTAKLKERGLHLDNLHKEGTINEQMYKLEKAAIESDDPMDALRMIAHAKDQTQLDEARALVSFKYGPKAPHLLKVIPSQWTPDFEERMTQMVIGPEKMAGIENTGLAREQAWDLAAIDDARADKQMAQTGAYQQGQLANTRRGQDLSASTQRRGQDLTDKRASISGGPDGTGGVKLSAANIEKVAAVDQSLGMLTDIENALPSMLDAIGPIDQWATWAKLKTGAGVTPELAEFDAQITGLKNAVIKATTGAAMSEPEAKRIMGQIPALGLPEKVFKARLATTRRNLELLKRRTIELSGGSVSTPAAVGKVRIQGKDGQTYEFPSQVAADAFKRAGG